MTISMIWAMDENRAIGIKGKLPWNLPDDLQYFKAATDGKPVIMGEKTYTSIGRLLPGRTNIILSDNSQFNVDGAVVVHTPEDAIMAAAETETDEAFIIGGAMVYKLFLPQAERLYITEVHTSVPDTDRFFPEFDRSEWEETSRQRRGADDRNEYSFSWTILERKLKSPYKHTLTH